MLIVILGLVLALISFGCSVFILIHAFQRSLGTGVMVLCIPCFMVYYAFSQFEHRRKAVIVSTWLASLVLTCVLYTLAAQGLQTYAPRFPS
jgi:hypothetical protein